VYAGQSQIPQGISTCCYSTGDCSGPRDTQLSRLFDISIAGDINHCCFDGNLNSQRPNPSMLSFRLGNGECRSCDRKLAKYSVFAIIILLLLWSVLHISYIMYNATFDCAIVSGISVYINCDHFIHFI